MRGVGTICRALNLLKFSGAFHASLLRGAAFVSADTCVNITKMRIPLLSPSVCYVNVEVTFRAIIDGASRLTSSPSPRQFFARNPPLSIVWVARGVMKKAEILTVA